RARDARTWPVRSPDPRDDALLGELQRGHHQWLVVVVGTADRRHRFPLYRALPRRRRPGRNLQPAYTESRLTGRCKRLELSQAESKEEASLRPLWICGIDY